MSDNNRPANDGDRAARGGRAGESQGTPGDDAARARRAAGRRRRADRGHSAADQQQAAAEQPDRLWAFGSWEADSNLGEQAPNDPYVGLINLGFIRAALRAQVRLWLGLGVVGFVLGFGVLTALPPAQKAATTVLL